MPIPDVVHKIVDQKKKKKKKKRVKKEGWTRKVDKEGKEDEGEDGRNKNDQPQEDRAHETTVAEVHVTDLVRSVQETQLSPMSGPTHSSWSMHVLSILSFYLGQKSES